MSVTLQPRRRCAGTCNGYCWARDYLTLDSISSTIGCGTTRPEHSWFAPVFQRPGPSGTKRDDAETERRTMLPSFVHSDAHRSWLLFTRSGRPQPQQMIVPQLLQKQRAPSWSFCQSNCSCRPTGGVALSIGEGLQNSLPEFRGCATHGVGFSFRS